MADDVSKDSGVLTPQDMRSWLKQELRDLSKAMEMRTQEASDFVVAYALGELSPEAVEKQFHRYRDRWADALPLHVTDTMRNEDISKEIDAVVDQRTRRLARKVSNYGLGQKRGGEEPSR